MTTMTTFDFAPLYRHAVGFDRVANMAQKRAKQQLTTQCVSDASKAKKTSADANSPRYNISQTDEFDYQITLALAGFSLDEIDITVTADELLITGKKQPVAQDSTLLYQSINQADFSRKFGLAEHVHVLNADMHQGLLTINLHREVPEALQPRKIDIGCNIPL